MVMAIISPYCSVKLVEFTISVKRKVRTAETVPVLYSEIKQVCFLHVTKFYLPFKALMKVHIKRHASCLK